ncbi:uncharacterized protein EI90DRAFT_3124044 [Cantharellus anzutake]|uniref:uncharacterized protein n=1 Tax=Cantharellus anzutake TaxID=1750568 RepID=UPI0019077E2D|nr:uncharacterized protein EI90DRAFT_3124044 [Cantharellus anzutake]KAF8330831.1 hypothetical protein EI90DRAFT_3124044 [Cantharellus anzutake]
MHDVAVRKLELQPKVGHSTFKLPAKVTVHDTKRDAWIADLADPQVPLSKLANSPVPHPFKGHDLLDMLHNKHIPIDRAVWYTRVLGANETHLMRSRPNFNPTQYSIDWANIVTSHLRKLIGEIHLPSAYRPGITIRQSFQGVLTDPESRARWISRFSYALSLLREYVAEGLVDHEVVLKWLCQLPGGVNLAQLGFATVIVQEYLEMLAENRAFLAPLLEGCLAKLSEIESSPFKDNLAGNKGVLEAIIQKSSGCDRNASYIQKCAMFYDKSFESISSRNDAITFRSLPPRAAASLRSTIVDIQILNSIGPTTNLHEVRFLSTEQENETWSQTFTRKLNILLTWSVTARSGEQPIYVAVCIIADWLAQTGPKRTPNPKRFVHDSLLSWLDTSEIARDHANYLANTSFLYGELVRRDLVSFTKLVQRIIARGDNLHRADGPSHLAVMLRAIPLTSSRGTYNARSAALYGVTDHEEDDENILKLQQEWVRVLPEFNPGAHARIQLRQDKPGVASPPTDVSIFDQWRLVHTWLLPPIFEHVQKSRSFSSRNILSLSIILSQTRCLPALSELGILLLRKNVSDLLVRSILDAFRVHHETWCFTDAKQTQWQALLNCASSAKEMGNYLSAASISAFLKDTNRGITAVASEYDSAPLQRPSSLDPNERLEPLLNELNMDNVVTAAFDLCAKFSAYPGWCHDLWEAVLSQIQRIPESEPGTQSVQVDVLARFICNVANRLTESTDLSMEEQFSKWLDLGGRNKIIQSPWSTSSAQSWSQLLIQLVISNVLSTDRVVIHLCGETWKSIPTTAKESPQLFPVSRFTPSRDDPKVFRDYFSGGSPLPTEDSSLVQALQLLMVSSRPRSKAGSERVNPANYMFSAIMSHITPWNFSHAKVELQLTLKQISVSLSHDETRPNAEAELEAFTTSFLERQLDVQETDLVADILRGINGKVAEQFLKGGLKRLTQLLNDFVSPSSVSISSQAGEVLRLLANVLRPLHYSPGSVPTLDPSVLDTFSDVLHRCFEKALKLIRPQRSPQEGGRSLLVPTNDLLQLVLLLVRMLQFEIVFRSVKTPIAREMADKRFAMLINTVQAFHETMRLTPSSSILFLAILDTASQLNPTTKGSRPGAGEQDLCLEISDFSPLTPPSLRSYITFISPYRPTDWYTANLFHARAAFSSNPTRLILGDPVQARPWEWVEFTGAPPTAKTSSRRINEDADGHREKIQDSDSKEDENMHDLMERRRSEDHFYSESVYERDWKEGRVTRDLLKSALTTDKRDGQKGDSEDQGEDAGGKPMPGLLVPNSIGLSSARLKMIPQLLVRLRSLAAGRMIVEVVVPTSRLAQNQGQASQQQPDRSGLKRKSMLEAPPSDPLMLKKGRLR